MHSTLYLITEKTRNVTVAQFIFRHDAAAFLAHLTKLMGPLHELVEVTVDSRESLTFMYRNRSVEHA